MSDLLGHISMYVIQNVGPLFHNRRADNIKRLNLNQILSRKNPYLFCAKNILTSQDLVKSVMDAGLSSGEETIFGNFIEGVAIEVCHHVFGGQKASTKGIDLDFVKGENRYIISIKSGPNWGNSSQIAKLKSDFEKALKTLRTSGGSKNKQIICVEGCCYGKDDNPDKGSHLKLCGQRFWELISDEKKLYTDIVEPLGHLAKENNEEFARQYAQRLNVLTQEFSKNFCVGGKIDWAKLVAFNSGKGRA